MGQVAQRGDARRNAIRVVGWLAAALALGVLAVRQAGVEREIEKIRTRLTEREHAQRSSLAAIAAREAARAKAIANALSASSAEAPPTEAGVGRPASSAGGNVFDVRLLDDEKYMAALAVTLRSEASDTYRRFYRLYGLSAEQVDRLERALVDRMITGSTATALMGEYSRNTKGSPRASSPTLRATLDEINRSIVSILGPDLHAGLLDYEMLSPVVRDLETIDTKGRYSGEALTDEQFKGILAIAKVETQGRPARTNYAMSDQGLTQAATFLGPNQMRWLTQIRDEKAARSVSTTKAPSK